MKIKLNVSKDLKRDLGKMAKALEQERSELIVALILELVNARKDQWESDIEKVMALASEEGISSEEKAKNNMAKTTKKLQPMIVNVEEQVYYALTLIAKNDQSTKEVILIDMLKDKVVKK